MTELQRLGPQHKTALLHFETENRKWFARSVPDRGDAYFATFPARHAALLAEQAEGVCHFHVLVDEDGAVLGRFNLVDVADGAAELGFRVAERVTGRGVATAGVEQTCALATTEYGLDRLVADAARNNPGSLGVLRRTGFRPVGEVTLTGKPGIRHVRELRSGQATPSSSPPTSCQSRTDPGPGSRPHSRRPSGLVRAAYRTDGCSAVDLATRAVPRHS